MTLEELKFDLRSDSDKYSKQAEECYERVKAVSASKSENKLLFTSILSIIPFMGVTGAIAFNMPEVASHVPVEAIPYITLASSAGIGSIGTKMFFKKWGITDKLKSFSKARTDKELLVEEIQNEIEFEQAINRRLVMDKAMYFLDEGYIKGIVPEESENVSSSKNLERKYEMLDLLSARKVLTEKFADVRNGNNNKFKFCAECMLAGMLTMYCGSMPFVWSNQLLGYGGNPVAVLSPFAAGTLGTGAYIIMRKKDRENVFHQFNSDLPNNDDQSMNIDDLIVELAKEEVKYRGSKKPKRTDGDPKLYRKEMNTEH